MVDTLPGAGRRPVPGGGRHWRGGGKPGRVCLKRPPELRDMLRVRDGPDRADLTPAQQELRRLLVERPGTFVARLAALEEAHRAAVRGAEAQRQASRKRATAAIQPPGEEAICDGPPDDLVALRADRVVRLFVPGRFLVECLTNRNMRVEGLDWFEVVGCRYDPTRGGVVILARSPDVPTVPAGGRIPEWVVWRGKHGRLFCP